MRNILLRELCIRFIKIFDIGYITLIYFILGILCAKLFDKIYDTFDENTEKKKSIARRTLELIGMMWVSGIIIYIVTNIVELIPSPFNGVCGFEHLRLKELKNGVVFVFVFLYFQKNFKSKLQLLYDNIGV